MPDPTAILGAVSSLKTAADLAGTFLKIRDASVLQSKVSELQGIILSAQSSALAAQADQFALLDAKRDLEKKIAKFEEWEREKERYELKAVCSGVFAFTPKPAPDGAGQPHLLCANCFEQGRKSYLQSGGIKRAGTTSLEGLERLHCTPCGSELAVYHPNWRVARSRTEEPVPSWKVV